MTETGPLSLEDRKKIDTHDTLLATRINVPEPLSMAFCVIMFVVLWIARGILSIAYWIQCKVTGCPWQD